MNSFASLSSGLLARKGGAKPAMRPQGFGQMSGMGLEDLGWNDMGHSATTPALVPDIEEERVPSSIAALTPAPRAVPPVQAEPQPEPQPEPEPVYAPPPVVEQQRAIEARFSEAEEAVEIAPARPVAQVVALPPSSRRAAGAKAKAAFTLRLDEARHLKLRLACAVTRRSAQQIVTQALDEFIASQPELETLAGHVPAKFGKRV
jgi:hypothetical protein